MPENFEGNLNESENRENNSAEDKKLFKELMEIQVEQSDLFAKISFLQNQEDLNEEQEKALNELTEEAKKISKKSSEAQAKWLEARKKFLESEK